MSITTYLHAYATLFVGRRDDFAVQLSTGRYKRAGKPLTQGDLYDHLVGVRTYGTYVIDAAGWCRFAVVDADSDDGLARLWTLQDHLAAHGIISSVEQSRRGGHLWVFLAHPVRASQVRAWLLPLCPADLEFYPKQDEGKGYGSLIRLPLGIHRKSGKRYHFIERGDAGQLIPLTLTDEDRVTWLASIKRMEVPQLEQLALQSRVRPSPSFSNPSQLRSGTSPIRDWNAAQDPYEVIGRYVDLDRNGVGRCPFGEHHSGGRDEQASFKVYEPGEPGGYCWYCYTWQRGGSVFDFLKYYYHLDAKTLWDRIQADHLR